MHQITISALSDTEHIWLTKLDTHCTFAVFKQHLISFGCPMDISSKIGKTTKND